MHILEATLANQNNRLRRARRIVRRGDQARDIGVEHSRAISLAPLNLSEVGGLDRYLATARAHRLQADRAFAVAHRLYAKAERVRLGLE